MKIVSTVTLMMASFLATALSSTAHAGYKDHPSYQAQPCMNCDQIERHVGVEVIHKPRPAMLHIPATGPRKRVTVTYHHSYQKRHTPNVQIIDRSTPLAQERHQRAEVILPAPRPLSMVRNRISGGMARLLGRR